MKLTNKKGYPDIIVEAVAHLNSKYSRGVGADISVTELISAPLQRLLKKKYYDEITEDVEDRIFSFYGSLAHELLENIQSESVLYKEQRLFMEFGGMTLSGQFDLIYKDKGKVCLADFKFTSKYAVKDGCKKDWERQLNIYKYMFENTHKDNLKIEKLEIIAPIRDAIFLDDKITVLPVKSYKSYKIKEYIEKQIAFHKICEDEITGQIPECTPEERWQDPEKFAVMIPGAKRSLKNHDSRCSAEAHASKIEDGYVEIRPAENKKCSRYCNVSKWCWWWQLDPKERPDSYEDLK